MTPKRIQALQWFHDRGEVQNHETWETGPMTIHLIRRMLAEGQLKARLRIRKKDCMYSLTNKGRRDLHEATR